MANLITCTCDGCTRSIEVENPERFGWVRAHAANRGGRSAWLCEFHAANVGSYYDENNKRRGKETTRYTGGCEFEVNRPSVELRRHFLAHGFIATHDSTVDCEFKSPIWDNRKGHRFFETVETLLNDGHGNVGNNCGTHFHVGHKDMIHPTAIRAIAANYHAIFDGLSAAMYTDTQGCAALFGRTLRLDSWAEPTHFGGYAYNHSNFVNIEHDYTIEWRICKFKTAKQYKLAMAFCYDATACILTNYLAYAHTDKAEHKAAITGNKLVRLYRKAAKEALTL